MDKNLIIVLSDGSQEAGYGDPNAWAGIEDVLEVIDADTGELYLTNM